MAKLRVLIDGQELDEAQARAFWQRFSAHMEAHRGDLAGFATSEGLTSVQPVVGASGPELHASHTQKQTPYTNAKPIRSTTEPSKIHPRTSDKVRKPRRSR